MKTLAIKFKDIQGEKVVFMNQRDLAIFLFDFSRDIELLSVAPRKRRIRKEQPA